MPGGKAPEVMVKDGAGEPVVVTVKLPKLPTENVALSALVITGADCTVRMALAGLPKPAMASTTVTEFVFTELASAATVTTTLQLLFAANWEEFNCTLEALKEAVPLHVVVEDVADKAGGRVLLKETAVSATVVFGLVIV